MIDPFSFLLGAALVALVFLILVLTLYWQRLDRAERPPIIVIEVKPTGTSAVDVVGLWQDCNWY